MNKLICLAGALLTAAAFPLVSHAHRAWIVPAATVLSSEDPWVTFDAAVSNDIFHTDHAPLRLDGVTAIAPDGSEIQLQNSNTGKYRSTFDLNLKQKGTYKVTSFSSGLRARWETDEGERRGWPGRGAQATAESFAKEVPANAKNLEVSFGSRRVETFVTAGTPDTKVFKLTNQGLELVPVTHPNDLFAGEKAEFKFLIDGKPAVGAKVEVVPGGARYRNKQANITAETDKNGSVSITWPQAGLYWMSVTYEDNKAEKPAKKRTGSYVATFEVLPE
jgi:uncharacterized GH25 family protein